MWFNLAPCSVLDGELIGVTGSVGAGKSSLLQAILGEMEPRGDGSIAVDKPQGRQPRKKLSFFGPFYATFYIYFATFLPFFLYFNNFFGKISFVN